MNISTILYEINHNYLCISSLKIMGYKKCVSMCLKLLGD